MPNPTLRTAILAALIPASAALADVHNTPVEFTHICNADGAVITLMTGTTIYLGKSCDAFVPGHGSGNWWYAANGFLVEAGDFYLKFPGSDAPCPVLPYCRHPG